MTVPNLSIIASGTLVRSAGLAAAASHNLRSSIIITEVSVPNSLMNNNIVAVVNRECIYWYLVIPSVSSTPSYRLAPVLVRVTYVLKGRSSRATL